MKTLFFLASICVLAWAGLILMDNSYLSLDQLKQKIFVQEEKGVLNHIIPKDINKADPIINQKVNGQMELVLEEQNDPPAVSHQSDPKIDKLIQKIKTNTKPVLEKIETFLSKSPEQITEVDDPSEGNDVLTMDITGHEAQPDHETAIDYEDVTDHETVTDYEDVIDYKTKENWIFKAQVSGERAHKALMEMNSILGRN
ncbi:MAG: hypothetical protein HOJ48_00055 [Desulfobacula sp.]|jgi:hypothetical protein|nr:hypothetical protein [Desulfobacula sp.]